MGMVPAEQFQIEKEKFSERGFYKKGVVRGSKQREKMIETRED